MRSPRLLFLFLFALPLYAREFDVRPAPLWVDEVQADASAAIARENVRWGIYDLLTDHQVRAGDGSEWQYFRTVRRILSPSGVQNASEVELDFDPSFERLVIHRVEIVRNGVRINALDPAEVRVIEKEDDASDRIYDGERTALLFLKDVRAGDIIDYAWSLEGANPLLSGRYTDQYDLSSGVPTRRMRHRLLWPAGHPLQWRGGDPTITMAGDRQSLVWDRSNIPALDVEDGIPTWFEPWTSIEVTEFASWQEVAAWANVMFELDARSIAEVKKVAASISGRNATREARINAAIRFVQDDIRYLGIEMGRNSHQPHQPWETLESRWGDCKDKTLLLVALLRELGVDAWPALVNTRLQRRLAEKLPSPFLFDHVIAQVSDGGRIAWVDSTIADQGGTLSTLETPNDGLALVVREGTSALTPVVTNTRGSTIVEQTYTTTDFAKPVGLTIRTTYSGADADAMRSELASISAEDHAHDRINHLAIDQPRIVADGRPAIHDDRLRNVIVISEKYRIPGLWKDGSWSWYPREIAGYLTRPDTMIRSMPLSFAYPLDVRQSVRFDFPEAVDVPKSKSVTETGTFRYESSVDSNGRTVSIRQSLHSRGDAVAVKDVPDHLTKLSAIWSEMGFRLAPPGATAPAKESSVSKWAVGLGLVTVFVAVSWMVAARKRPIHPVAIAVRSFAPGEAPASALRVGRSEDIAARLTEFSCVCGGTRYSPPEFQRARYAESDLTIVVRQCGACGKEQSIYFTAA